MPKEKNPKFLLYNRLHKKLVVLYRYKHMKTVWNRARMDYLEETLIDLPSSLHKHLDAASVFESWLDKKIEIAGLSGKIYFNKSDLKGRGWNTKTIKELLPQPDRIMNLGRGRCAYYYDLDTLLSIEESEQFWILKTKRKASENKKNESENLGIYNLI